MKRIIVILLIALFFGGACSTDPIGPEEDSIYPSATSLSIGSHNQVFVATYLGIYHSIDNGVTWKTLTNQYTHFVSVSPSGTIYCTSAISEGSMSFAETLWRSSDGGATFQITGWVNQSAGFGGFRWLAFNNQEHLFYKPPAAGTLHRSTSQGNSWESIFSDYNLNSFIAPNNIFINGSDGVYRSDNNGDSWMRVLSMPDLSGDTSYSYDALAFNSLGRIYVGINASHFQNYPVETGKIYYSDDNGYNWIKIAALNRNITHFAINSNDKIFVITELNEVFSSTNNGSEWKKAGMIFTESFVEEFIISPNNTLFIRTRVDGVYRIYRSQNDGATWEQFWPYY